MNKNDKSFMAQRIRAQYVEKEATELDAPRRLDAAVKRPADIFAYAFGGVGAIVMGGGMSLVMTDLGATLGIGSALAVGTVIGVIGMAMAIACYPIYKRILNGRKKKHAARILELSEKIISND